MNEERKKEETAQTNLIHRLSFSYPEFPLQVFVKELPVTADHLCFCRYDELSHA